MNPLITTIVGAVAPELPRAISHLYDSFMEWFEDEPKTKPTRKVAVKKKAPRKAADTHRFTQKEYNFIYEAHHKYVASKQNKVYELIPFLNDRLSLNKSISAYRNIWAGNVIYKSLAIGDTNFDPSLPQQLPK
tara:strand:+ start:794 stop:1192 length:399 start_codon:yes stop_codon:yes gene_type:complete